MLVTFPHDVVGAWTARHNIELSKEAFEDLIEQFWTYSEKPEVLTANEISSKVAEDTQEQSNIVHGHTAGLVLDNEYLIGEVRKHPLL